MALILLLETTTINCSVALAEDDKVIAIKEDKTPGYSHAEKLHLFMEAVLAEGQKELLDLDAVAVSKGPGSYTGLRIGVSAAKGLCYALNIPLIAVDTLTSVAHQYQSLNFS
ncbi:MAG: tRNA (adenosine(37)-N6)-threonylcarbamoyltransferase complex dimerization subunit type 1 TsaB, partial [Mesonia sp.]